MSVNVQQIVEDTMSGAPKQASDSTLPGAISYIIRTSDLLPPWWSRRRDSILQEVVHKSNHLSGLSTLATQKLVSIPLRFVPKDPTIISHADEARDLTEIVHLASEYGQTLRSTFKKFIQDYLHLDNGGFMEVMGDGRRDGPIVGRPKGLRHLDSMACTRTGDHMRPVRVEEDGKRYLIHWTRIIYMSQQPSPRARMNGVGFSSVSRSDMLAQVLNDQIVYKLEKMGSRPTSQIIAASGMEAIDIVKAFAMAEEMMDNLGLSRYAKVVAMGGDNIEVDKLDLNEFQPFDEEVGTAMAIFALAFIWGLDVRDIWPVSGGKATELSANMRARGRLPADFTGDLKRQFDLKVCPSYLETEFDFQDDEEDQQRAIIQDIRSRRVQRLAENGVMDREGLRRMMLVTGEISREEFIRQQLAEGKLEDGTPVSTLFFSNDPLISALTSIPGVDEPLVPEVNEPDIVVENIHRHSQLSLELLATTRSESQRRKAQMALAALDWLEGLYVGPKMVAMPDLGEEVNDTIEEAGYDEEE